MEKIFLPFLLSDIQKKIPAQCNCQTEKNISACASNKLAVICNVEFNNAKTHRIFYANNVVVL